MSPFPPPSLRLKAPEASLRPVSSLRVQTVNVPLMFGRAEHQWHIYGLHVVCPNREQKRSDRGFLLERWRRTRRKLRPRWNSTEMEPVRFKIFLCIWEFVVRSASRSSGDAVHQNLTHGSNRTAEG